MSQRWYVVQKTKDCTVKHKQPMEAPSAPRPMEQYEQPLDAPSTPKSSWQAVGEPDAPTWKLSGTQGTASFWEKTEAPLPLQNAGVISDHLKQLIPFLERSELPFPSEGILLGYDDVVSSSQDRYTTWVKTDTDVTLEQQMVDIQKAVADYREAAARRQESTT